MSDRYTKALLTGIALELLWFAVWGWSKPVNAQPSEIPVVITGIRLNPSDDPLPVAVEGLVVIEADSVLTIRADEPLPVKAVPYTPAQRPGD